MAAKSPSIASTSTELSDRLGTTETRMHAEISEAEVKTEIAVHKAEMAALIRDQAEQVGMSPAEWQALVLESPGAAAVRLQEAGVKAEQRAKREKLPDLGNVLELERKGARSSDLEAMARSLLPADKKKHYTVLVDPPGQDGVRRGWSMIALKDAPRHINEFGFSMDWGQLQWEVPTLPCQFTLAAGGPCPHRSTKPEHLLDHHRYHHPSAWAARMQQEAADKAEDDRQQAKLTNEALLKILQDKQTGESSNSEALAAAMGLMAQILERMNAPAAAA